MKINRIDHIVLTVKDIDKTVEFYGSVMGMTKEAFAKGRVALSFPIQTSKRRWLMSKPTG
ncbi:VOC family protein [Candidatus Thiodiazotropha sp. CDECU1]|uniref:VOC family protein n=1 Tax=Candidatus Thiodiazotropha sp. CDECU1 TaxID=3065865 RepID=UPI00292DC341|nr:VOC family protein [Candidatus Thiodiazotropha sp. CDECU1]